MIYIQIGEHQYPFAFGMAGVRRFEEATKRPIGSVLFSFAGGDMANVMFSDITLIMSCGLETGAKKAKAPRAFPIEEVEEMLDDCPDMWGVVTKGLEELANSLNKQEEAPQEAKKKPTVPIVPAGQTG